MGQTVKGSNWKKEGPRVDTSPESPLPLRQISGERTVHGQACSGYAFQVQRKLTRRKRSLTSRAGQPIGSSFRLSRNAYANTPTEFSEEKLVSRADSGNSDIPRLTAHLVNRRGLDGSVPAWHHARGVRARGHPERISAAQAPSH